MVCPFCAVPAGRIVLKSEAAIAFSVAYPLSEGHMLVGPRLHVNTIYELTSEEQRAVWQLVAEVRSKLLQQFNPDGFNIGLNDGAAAGQTVMHAHIHIIPRRHGDVADPRGGIRWVIAKNAPYWDKR